MNDAPPLAHLERPAAAEPEGALVLLHGRGADEHDLFPLLDALDPERRLVGATPRGPLSLPPGGAHWYVVERVGYPDPPTFTSTYGLLSEWLDGFLATHDIPADRLVLGGFSQGTVMAYALTLDERRERPRGLLALSGFIPSVEGFPLAIDRARDLPITVGHGSHDPVISVGFARNAASRLEEAGADLTYHEAPMGHQIDPRFLGSLPRWLRATLGDATRS